MCATAVWLNPMQYGGEKSIFNIKVYVCTCVLTKERETKTRTFKLRTSNLSANILIHVYPTVNYVICFVFTRM